jgi:hypothetical protein
MAYYYCKPSLIRIEKHRNTLRKYTACCHCHKHEITYLELKGKFALPEPASQQPLASAAAAAVEIVAAAAAEMPASSFASAAVVSDVVAVKVYSSYWCLT